MIGCAETRLAEYPARADQKLAPRVEFGVQRNRLRTAELEIKLEVVLQVLADPGQILPDFDAGLLQNRARTDAGQLQQMRRGDRPRAQDYLAPGADRLQAAAARVLDPAGALAVEQDPLRQCTGKNREVREILEFYLQSSVNTRLSRDIETLKSSLFEAEQALNTDAKLSASIEEAKNVVLAMIFYLGIPRGKPDDEMPDFVLQNSISQIRDRIGAQQNGLFPIPTVAESAVVRA